MNSVDVKKVQASSYEDLFLALPMSLQLLSDGDWSDSGHLYLYPEDGRHTSAYLISSEGVSIVNASSDSLLESLKILFVKMYIGLEYGLYRIPNIPNPDKGRLPWH